MLLADMQLAWSHHSAQPGFTQRKFRGAASRDSTSAGGRVLMPTEKKFCAFRISILVLFVNADLQFMFICVLIMLVLS